MLLKTFVCISYLFIFYIIICNTATGHTHTGLVPCSRAPQQFSNNWSMSHLVFCPAIAEHILLCQQRTSVQGLRGGAAIEMKLFLNVNTNLLYGVW